MNFSSNKIFHSVIAKIYNQDILIIYYDIGLCFLFICFVCFNLLPKGLRRKYMNANRRRYAHSTWWNRQKGEIGLLPIKKKNDMIVDEYLVAPLGEKKKVCLIKIRCFLFIDF